MPEDLKLYTIAEVAEILKVTERTVYNYVKDRTLKAAKIGKHWRIRASDFKAFIDESIITD